MRVAVPIVELLLRPPPLEWCPIDLSGNLQRHAEDMKRLDHDAQVPEGWRSATPLRLMYHVGMMTMRPPPLALEPIRHAVPSLPERPVRAASDDERRRGRPAPRGGQLDPDPDVGGLILALPIVLTFWIIYWLYTTLKQICWTRLSGRHGYAITTRTSAPAAPGGAGRRPRGRDRVVVATLYFLGLFVRSRLHTGDRLGAAARAGRHHDLQAVRNVFKSLTIRSRGNGSSAWCWSSSRIPGSRALAFVTNTLRDATNDGRSSCVCVLRGSCPRPGLRCSFPKTVTDLDWTMNQTCKRSCRAGSPRRGRSTTIEGLFCVPSATGPIIDPHGHPIESDCAAE